MPDIPAWFFNFFKDPDMYVQIPNLRRWQVE